MSSREELLLLRVVWGVADETGVRRRRVALHRLDVVVVAIEAQRVRLLHHRSRLAAAALALVTRLADAHLEGAVRRQRLSRRQGRERPSGSCPGAAGDEHGCRHHHECNSTLPEHAIPHRPAVAACHALTTGPRKARRALAARSHPCVHPRTPPPSRPSAARLPVADAWGAPGPPRARPHRRPGTCKVGSIGHAASSGDSGWKRRPGCGAVLGRRGGERRVAGGRNRRRVDRGAEVKPGDHLLAADVDAMTQALARHPWLRQVEVHRCWPPALTVRVRERRAAALVELSGLYLVDEAGEVFKRAAPGDGLDLPLVTGLGRAEYVQRRASFEARLQGALALLRAWRAGRGEALGRLSEIHVEADGATIYVGDEGTQVRLGTGDLQEELSRLAQVLSALRAEGKKADVLHLDNRIHPSWVTVRLAGVTPPAVKVVGGP